MCNNSIRLLINYIEKFKILDTKITLSIAKNICTNISYDEFEKYTKYILKKNIKKSIQLLFSIFEKGYSVGDILDSYFIFVKMTTFLNEHQKYIIIKLICKYIIIFQTIHEDEVELALFTNELNKNLS